MRDMATRGDFKKAVEVVLSKRCTKDRVDNLLVDKIDIDGINIPDKLYVDFSEDSDGNLFFSVT